MILRSAKGQEMYSPTLCPPWWLLPTASAYGVEAGARARGPSFHIFLVGNDHPDLNPNQWNTLIFHLFDGAGES